MNYVMSLSAHFKVPWEFQKEKKIWYYLLYTTLAFNLKQSRNFTPCFEGWLVGSSLSFYPF